MLPIKLPSKPARARTCPLSGSLAYLFDLTIKQRPLLHVHDGILFYFNFFFCARSSGSAVGATVSAVRQVHLPEGAKDPVTFRLAYNTTDHPLPPGVDEPELAEYTLTGAACPSDVVPAQSYALSLM